MLGLTSGRHTSRRSPIILLLAMAVALGAVACGGDEELPPPGRLLRDAATTMAGVTTVSFGIEVTGPAGSLGLRRAEGVLTRSGDAEGTLLLDFSGQLIEYEVVSSGGTIYLKGPTGGFQPVPSILAGVVYDPSTLLDPDEGVSELIRRLTDAETEAAESVEGTDAYRVRATLQREVLANVLPVDFEAEDIEVTLWVGRDRAFVLRVAATERIRGEEQDTTVRVTMGDFNAPVEISPPPQ
jgi:lipoprotein LprG